MGIWHLIWGGMIPVFGFGFDLINAAWYAAEGNYAEAAWSGAAAVPGMGDTAIAMRWGSNGLQAASSSYNIARSTVRTVDVGVNLTQGGSAIYQGYQDGNYLQMAVGVLGIGMNVGYIARHTGDIAEFFAENPTLHLRNYGLEIDPTVLGTVGGNLRFRYRGPQLGSGNAYSVAFEMQMRPTRAPIGTREAHFQAANKALLDAMDADPTFAAQIRVLVPGVDNLRGPRGGISNRSPGMWTWNHDAYRPGVMQLVPRVQHRAKNPLWSLFHPGNVGGFDRWGHRF